MNKKPFNTLDISEQVMIINHALEAEVTPMLMSHGGGIEIMDIEDWTVIIQYQGACHGCPMASAGTLSFIEQALQDQIDERIIVVPA